MKWILCSRKSPKEKQEIMLTFKNSAGIHVGEATFKNDAYYYMAETDKEHFEDIYRIPIAWGKHPKPYKIKE